MGFLQVVNSQFLAIRTLRRMFSYKEFPRALGRSEALVTTILAILRLLRINNLLFY